MRETLLEKAQRKIANSYPDYEYDEDLLSDYFDDACSIIKDWLKLSDDATLITGDYDFKIVTFIIQSLVSAGLEGQSSSSANGVSKVFYGSPESNLKKSISQRL